MRYRPVKSIEIPCQYQTNAKTRNDFWLAEIWNRWRQRAYCRAMNRSQSEEAVMSDEDSNATLKPILSARDQNDDLAGASILTLLQRSADIAEGNSQYAVGIAKDLSARLIASEAKVAELTDRVAELEVEVQVYRDRSEQAEQWLNKISSELQGRVAGKP
jgi:hypothetical protein